MQGDIRSQVCIPTQERENEGQYPEVVEASPDD